jgi:hypothetical protein
MNKVMMTRGQVDLPIQDLTNGMKAKRVLCGIKIHMRHTQWGLPTEALDRQVYSSQILSALGHEKTRKACGSAGFEWYFRTI